MRRLFPGFLWLRVATCAAGVTLAACGPVVRQAPRTYAQSTDSATAGCRQNPLLCRIQPGEHSSTVPTAPPTASLPGGQGAALKPGGFSVSLRYRIDPHTGLVQYLSQTQVKALLDAGRSTELLGTIEPDVIIHGTTPLQVQVVFDFKFPCVNGGQPGWRRYPEGHPHHEYSQKELYETFLKTRAFRVVPRWGILN